MDIALEKVVQAYFAIGKIIDLAKSQHPVAKKHRGAVSMLARSPADKINREHRYPLL